MSSPDFARQSGRALVPVVVLLAVALSGLVIFYVTRADLDPESDRDVVPAVPGTEASGTPEIGELPVATTPTRPPTAPAAETAAVDGPTLRIHGTVEAEGDRPLGDFPVRWIPLDTRSLRPVSHDLSVVGPAGMALRIPEGKIRQAILDSHPARTDAEGRYEIVIPYPPVLGVVVAAGDGYEIEMENLGRVDLGERGSEVEVDFESDAASSISGSVTDRLTGEPAVGMTVQAGILDSTAPALLAFVDRNAPAAVVGEDGRYHLAGLPPGAYRVVARTGWSDYVGVKTREGNKVILDPTNPAADVDFLVERGGSILGRVVGPDEIPVPGARCGAMPQDLIGASMGGDIETLMTLEGTDERSDDEGFFVLRGLPVDASYRVMARVDGLAPGVAEVKLTPDEPIVEIDLLLTEGCAVAGRVIDEAGSPVAGIRVGLDPHLGDLMAGRLPLSLDEETDDAGEFRFEHLPAGEYNVQAGERRPVLGEGPDMVTIAVDGVTDVEDLELQMRPTSGTGLAGIVVDDLGDPVENVRVTITAASAFMGFPTHSSRTAEDGRFSADDLPDGPFTITASRSGYESARLEKVEGGSTYLELALIRSSRISGRVVTIEGAEPGRRGTVAAHRMDEDFLAQIEAMSQGGKSAGFKGEVKEDGTFTVSAGVGTFEIVVSVPGFAPATSSSLEVSAGQHLEGIELTVSNGAKLQGKVTLGGNRGIEGATITVKPVKSDDAFNIFAEMMPQLFATGREQVQTDAEGAYEIAHLAPGTYSLRAAHPDYAPSDPVEVRLAEDQVKGARALVLSRGGEVLGRLLQEKKPKVGLMVQLIGVGLPMEMATSDSDGRFHFKRLRPGGYSLIVSDLSEMQKGRMAMKQRSIDIVEGQPTEVNLVFGEGVRVHGQVTGLPPAPFRMLTLRRPGGPGPEELEPTDMEAGIEAGKYQAGMAMVTPDGKYEVVDVEPGTYILEILRTPDNPADLAAYSRMDRTPHYRRVITIGKEDVEHDIQVKR